jgi:hypothetical protein
MQTPIIQHRSTPIINVGHRSDGKVVGLNLADTSPLFITFPDKRSWHEVVKSVSASCDHDSNIHWYLYLHQSSLSHWRQYADAKKITETYIIDDPGAGTLTSRKKFVRAILKACKHRPASPRKKKTEMAICIIDDIWEFIQKADRSDAKKIADMLRNREDKPFYVIAGSSAGHRNLFPALLKPLNTEPASVSTGQSGHIQLNRAATELILGTEGLVFRSHPGGQIWEKWYAPTEWQTVNINGKPPESLSNLIPTSIFPSSDSIEMLPENAQVYHLEG